MIETYSIENFKAFRLIKDFRFKPITIICGTNSCGKSSFLQSLLLLKQTSTSEDSSKLLVLDGKLARLGTIKNIIFQEGIASGGKTTPSDRVVFDIAYSLQDQPEAKRVCIELTYCGDKAILKSLEIDSPASSTSRRIRLILSKSDNNTYSLDYNGDLLQHVCRLNGIIGLVPEVSLYYQPECTSPIETFRIQKEINSLLSNTRRELKQLFSSLNYIGPFREPPFRRYSLNDEFSEIGSKGENAPRIFQAERTNQISDYYFCNELIEDHPFEKRTYATLETGIAEWLEFMGIEGLELDNHEELFSLRVNSSSSSKKKVNVCDIGFGFSQVFPIILEGLRMPINNTLLLEQPEIHLHPKMQMQLADFFIAMAQSGKNFIIETHSDHMINRIVRRIVEDNTDSLAPLVDIHFAEPGPNGTVFKSVDINDVFGIVEWPDDFFDQTLYESERTAMASLRKRKYRSDGRSSR